MNKLTMALFITGRTVRTNTALKNLQEALVGFDQEEYELNIIDVLEDPGAAEEQFILATPTLVKYYPLPVRKIIGDLSDTELLLESLELATPNT